MSVTDDQATLWKEILMRYEQMDYPRVHVLITQLLEAKRADYPGSETIYHLLACRAENLYKLKLYDACIMDCSQTLRVWTNDYRVLYIRMLACMETGKSIQMAADYNKAMSIKMPKKWQRKFKKLRKKLLVGLSL